MELEEVIKSRRSIRKFKKIKIEKEKLLKTIDAAQWAPSACNKQAWKFIVVEQDNIKKELVKKAGSVALIKNAPTVVIITYQKDYSANKLANVQSASAAIQNMLLTIHANGLGATWLASFGNIEKVKEILKIPDEYLIIAFIAMGYPDEKSWPPKRQSVENVVSFNKFDFPPEKTYPSSPNPKKWSMYQIKQFRENSLRATSPMPDSHPIGTMIEVKKEVEIASKWVDRREKVLEILPFAGTHTISLLKEKELEEYNVYELSEECVLFLNERKKRAAIQQSIGPIVSDVDSIPAADASFDVIISFQKIETLPDLRVIDEIERLIKPGGKFILSFRNAESFYWMYYLYKYKLKKEEISNYGPFKPVRYSTINSLLQNKHFKIEEERGISLLPTREGSIVKPPLSRFCRLVLLKCEKK